LISPSFAAAGIAAFRSKDAGIDISGPEKVEKVSIWSAKYTYLTVFKWLINFTLNAEFTGIAPPGGLEPR
jgi:hypothetical protein